MNLEVIALYDSKTNAYNLPQFVQSIGGAVRSFADEINRADANNVLFNHPGDFLLFHIGSWDDETCVVAMLDEYRIIAVGNDYKKEPN